VSERVTTLWAVGPVRTLTMLGWLRRRQIGVHETEAGRGRTAAAGGWPMSRTLDLVMQDIDRRFGAEARVAGGDSRSLLPGGESTRS